MKKLTLLFMLVINTSLYAQRQQAFFCSDSANIKNIASLIIENTEKKYHLDRVIHRTWNVEFWYRYDPHTMITIHFQIFPDKSAILKGLTGNYEDIFPFWKKYFQEDADTEVIEKAGVAKSASATFLKGDIVYIFRRISTLWEIKPYSLVNPTKK